MGRTGIEPVTLGLKVLHIEVKSNMKKRRFEPLYKPFRNALERFWTAVSSRDDPGMSRFAIHLDDCVAFCVRKRGAFMVR
jgi:hypothetical protein